MKNIKIKIIFGMTILTILSTIIINIEGTTTDFESEYLLQAGNQELGETNIVVIEEVTTNFGGGFVVIKNDNTETGDSKRNPGSVLGSGSFVNGTNSNIEVTIDRANLTFTLYVVLYNDTDSDSSFDINKDAMYIIRDEPVYTSFSITNFNDINEDAPGFMYPFVFMALIVTTLISKKQLRNHY